MVSAASVIFAATLSALLGLAFCFLGYHIFLVLLPVWGFFAGFWLGAQTIALIVGTGFLATVTGWVVGVIAGLILAVLSYLFFIVGVAIVAAAIGAAIGTGLMAALGFDSGLLVTLVGLVSAVVLAVLTLRYSIQKYVIIAITALAGARAADGSRGAAVPLRHGGILAAGGGRKPADAATGR
jgi:hypothetical protein